MEDMRLLIEDVWFPEEEKLLVRATVTEDATGAKEVGEHSSTVFSHYLYNVYLTKSRRYYHVGQPYYIQVLIIIIRIPFFMNIHHSATAVTAQWPVRSHPSREVASSNPQPYHTKGVTMVLVVSSPDAQH